MSSANSASISCRKRPLELAAFTNPTKSRSKLPRRPRAPLLPIVDHPPSHASFDPVEEGEEAHSSSSCFQSNISLESKAVGTTCCGALPTGFRRMTRSYTRRIRDAACGEDPKLPVVEMSKSESALGTEVSEVVEEFPCGKAENKAVASKTSQETGVSVSSCINSVTGAVSGWKITAEEATGRSQISQNSVTSSKEVPRCDQDLDSDLVYSEGLSKAGDEESSEHLTCNEMTASEIDDLFSACSDLYDDYSLSDLVVSSSSSDGFSWKYNVNAAPSTTYALFLQLARQFSPTSFIDPVTERDTSLEFNFMRFENEEDEASYRILRGREKAGAVAYDYTKEYSNTTNYGRLIMEQRLVMVNWIVEAATCPCGPLCGSTVPPELEKRHCSTMELQSETLFLAVSLLDHFLSKGSFGSTRSLQLLGIACITLATRIEENQPYNSIRQISFKVENNYYNRSEVVAMEWLVQEVLQFKCFLPTIHNFLWFYLKAAKVDTNAQNLSRYLAVLSLLDHERLSFKPSSVAAGLVILTCLATNSDASCQMVIETHVRTKSDDLSECMQSLQWLVKYAR